MVRQRVRGISLMICMMLSVSTNFSTHRNKKRYNQSERGEIVCAPRFNREQVPLLVILTVSCLSLAYIRSQEASNLSSVTGKQTRYFCPANHNTAPIMQSSSRKETVSRAQHEQAWGPHEEPRIDSSMFDIGKNKKVHADKGLFASDTNSKIPQQKAPQRSNKSFKKNYR